MSNGKSIKIDFSTFILSLNSATLVHLGVLVDPMTQKNDIDLELAKQTIDILSILKDKTANNLEEEEEKLLNNILHDLKIKYVEASK